MATIIELPLISADGVVAEIFDIATGAHVDSTYNFETALTYVQDGAHVAIAVADDVMPGFSDAGDAWGNLDAEPYVRMTKERAQAMYNNSRLAVEDCYGLAHFEFAA